jgi:hypothetical protein
MAPARSDERSATDPGLVDQAVLPVKAATSWEQIDNPARDGWTIEVQAERAKHALTQIGEVLFGPSEFVPAELQPLAAPDFQGTRLLPTDRTVVFEDELMRIERMSAASTTADDSPIAYRGHTGWLQALEAVAKFWRPLEDRRFEFKIFRARLEDVGQLVTHQYLAVSGWRSERFIEQHATWVVRWRAEPDSDSLVIQSIDVVDFEETAGRQAGKLFADCTPSVLQHNACYESQFLFGMNYWLDRTQDMRYFSPLGNPGLAVGDVDGDGRDDLYVCQEANLPNRLFVQQADGSARDVAAAWQVDWLEGSRSALLVDLDNDGDQDLAVAILGGIVLAANEGGRFSLRDVLETNDDTTTLAAADYDLDGDLDLYVCVDYPNDYFASTRDVTVQGGAANRMYHDANNGGRNSLFRNDIARHDPAAAWQFTDVTAASGLDQNNRRYTWSASWEDYDEDGDQDLYVANDFGRNNLYANEGGHFIDTAGQANAEDSASGMSAAWGDVNRDGLMDLYIGNMFSSAGGRITFQPEFKADADEATRQRLKRFARGNTLLENLGDATFRDVSEEAGVTVGRWAWSSNFLDVNNDGWQDIAVANGYITSEDTSDL